MILKENGKTLKQLLTQQPMKVLENAQYFQERKSQKFGTRK
jgi:hypothetical protein